MKQNKSQFIFDFYAEVIGGQLDRLVKLLNAGGIAYAAEPWPEGHYRVYVKKDAAGMLRILEESIKRNDAADDGKGVSK
jgi:hypothetical protein